MSTILITGANRGIGLALTKIYAERGDKVFACCRDPEKAEELTSLAQTAAVELISLAVDSEESVSAMAVKLAATPIEVLINNAGVIGGARETQTATSMDFSAWEQAFQVNTMGPVRVMQALLPSLKLASTAKIMNITSQMGAISCDFNMAYGYCATKAALNKFMRLAAQPLKSDGIAVGLVHPGWVQTDMGGPGAAITPEESAEGVVAIIDRLTLENTGRFWKWDGEEHEW